MSKSSKSNVVALGDLQRFRPRLSRQQSAQVLSDCRTLAIDRMGRALAGMLDRIEQDLFDLASGTQDRGAQEAYLDARAQARDKRAAIEDTFRKHFEQFFDRKVRGEPAARADDSGVELKLVADDELQGRLAVEEMARKLRASCDIELAALSERMSFLLDQPDLPDEGNPLSPGTVCAALKDACDQLEASYKVRMTLLQQLERYVAADLQRIYHDVNAHLIARSVLPEPRPRFRRAAAGGLRTAPAPRRTPSPLATNAASAVKGIEVLATLADLLATAAPDATRTVPATFVGELTRMHRGTAPAAAQGALDNVVRSIKATPHGASLGGVDAVTIDLVAMLFDFIFGDEHIPAAAKALLGRLQIPTLKVALLDRSFFSSKCHPARRLLDLLAESAMGLDHHTPREAEVLRFMERTVQRVNDEFTTDLKLFEAAAGEVARFIEERQRAEAKIVERSARLIEEREREENAQLAAQEAVTRRLAAREWVPAIVRSMLQDTWRQALARAHRSEGEGSAAWQGLIATMDDLLWSVEPKQAADDRKRLVTILPGMLRMLHQGMDRAGTLAPERAAFLGALVDCHALAMKAGVRGLAAMPEPPAPAPVVQVAPAIERSTVPIGDIRVEEIRLRVAGAGRPQNVFTRTGIWTHLQRGTWVEFTSADGTRMRARLTWISPNKGVYLFTNPFSAAAGVSIAPDALAEQMRLGEARVMDDAPLTERAVDSMLATLKDSQG